MSSPLLPRFQVPTWRWRAVDSRRAAFTLLALSLLVAKAMAAEPIVVDSCAANSIAASASVTDTPDETEGGRIALQAPGARASARVSSDANVAPAAEGDAPEAFRFARKPRWELGIGGGYLDGFDYPASRDPNQRGIALPFFIYRSPVWRVGDGGVGAVALERPRVRLDLSLAGSLSASSEGNSARQGMPDLDYLLELGPQLEVRLLEHDWGRAGRSSLNWRTKLRAVLVTDFGSVDSLGTVFATGLNFRQRDLAGKPVDVILNLEATLASEGVQGYFYEVGDEFATPERAAYEARSGYLQSRVFLALAVRPVERLRLFAGVSTGLFAGSANEDSPLHETDRSTGGALGFVWTMLQSKERIPVLDTE